MSRCLECGESRCALHDRVSVSPEVGEAIDRLWGMVDAERLAHVETRRKSADVSGEWHAMRGKLAVAESALSIVRAHADNVWFWQGDGCDNQKSLACPVVMSAETLRGLVDELTTARAKLSSVCSDAEDFIVAMDGAERVPIASWTHLLDLGRKYANLVLGGARDGRRIERVEPPPAPLAMVPRGHCNRCDRCGWPLSNDLAGCPPMNCSQRPAAPLRDTCAGCGAPFDTSCEEKR